MVNLSAIRRPRQPNLALSSRFGILDRVTSQLAVLKPSSLTDWLLEHGRHFVTTPEIAELLGVSATSVPVTLHRARTANKIVSVTKGAWVPVPPAHRSAGAPPPVQFIDELMNHLGHPYYIGFLSAARIHGASHQVPMSLQVVTPAHLRDRRIGDHPVRFIRRSATAERATERRQTGPASRGASSATEVATDPAVCRRSASRPSDQRSRGSSAPSRSPARRALVTSSSTHQDRALVWGTWRM